MVLQVVQPISTADRVAACAVLDLIAAHVCRCNRSPPLTELRRRDLDKAVLAAFVASGGTHGSPQVAEELHNDGWTISTSTVAASMRRQALSAPQTPRTQSVAAPRGGRCDTGGPDRAGLRRRGAEPEMGWGIQTGPRHRGTRVPRRRGGSLQRRLVGFALSDSTPTAQLAADAISMAVAGVLSCITDMTTS